MKIRYIVPTLNHKLSQKKKKKKNSLNHKSWYFTGRKIQKEQERLMIALKYSLIML